MNPVGPVFPVGPVGPVSPVGPVQPVTPVLPVGPVKPVGPVGPVQPVGPVSPMSHCVHTRPCCVLGPGTKPANRPRWITCDSLVLVFWLLFGSGVGMTGQLDPLEGGHQPL